MEQENKSPKIDGEVNNVASKVRESPTSVDAQALAEFREFLNKNKDNLKTGMGAFHHDGHSNW